MVFMTLFIGRSHVHIVFKVVNYAMVYVAG